MKPNLILGTAQLGLDYGINNIIGKVSEKSAYEILDFAFENGVNYIDTASLYGTSEKVIGNYINESNKYFKIFSKINPQKKLQKSIDDSLKNLKSKKIYCLLFHSFKDYLNRRKEIDEFLQINKYSKFDKFGVSVYENYEIEELLNDSRIEVIQAPFNLLDNEKYRSKIFKKAKEKNIEIISRSTFLQGLFFVNPINIPQELKGIKNELLKINSIKEYFDIKIEDLALLYPISKNYIDGIIIGIESVDQLSSNLKCLEFDLDKKIEVLIDKISTKNINLLNPGNWKK